MSPGTVSSNVFEEPMSCMSEAGVPKIPDDSDRSCRSHSTDRQSHGVFPRFQPALQKEDEENKGKERDFLSKTTNPAENLDVFKFVSINSDSTFILKTVDFPDFSRIELNQTSLHFLLLPVL